jgi:O-antigen ligase
MLLYERLVSPLGVLVETRDYARYGGLYADTVSYALYSVGAMLVAGYFFLAQPPYARYRTHALRLVVVGCLFVLALMSMHHAASYGVGGALLLLLIVSSVGSGRGSILVVVGFAVVLGAILVGDVIAERVAVMFSTDLAVLSGEKQTGQAFHGRMLRWEVYLDYWAEMPALAKLFGVSLSGASESMLNYMLLGGIHSDYLRVTFASGLVGLALYLGFYAGLLRKALQARWAERFLITGAVAIVLMYSITILPTLYAPLMYFCLPVFAYATLPRHALKEAAALPALGAGPSLAPFPYRHPPYARPPRRGDERRGTVGSVTAP